MSRELLSERIGPVPPSTVDVAGIVRRERRMRTARLSGVGLSAFVALTVTVAMLVTPHGTAPPPPPSASPSASELPDGRIRLLALDQVTAEDTGNRLGKVLTAAVAKVSPKTTWVPDKPGEEGAQVRPLFSEKNNNLLLGYSGGGPTRTGKQDGSFNVYISHDRVQVCGEEPGCTVREGPGGAKLYARDSAQRYEVQLEVTGGFRLLLSVEDGGTGTPPISLDGLVAAAFDFGAQVRG